MKTLTQIENANKASNLITKAESYERLAAETPCGATSMDYALHARMARSQAAYWARRA